MPRILGLNNKKAGLKAPPGTRSSEISKDIIFFFSKCKFILPQNCFKTLKKPPFAAQIGSGIKMRKIFK
jgi:hypothetical protein